MSNCKRAKFDTRKVKMESSDSDQTDEDDDRRRKSGDRQNIPWQERRQEQKEDDNPHNNLGESKMIYKVVEFNFEASKNGICSENFKQGCPTFKITGVMHIPLLQCPRTGHFQAPLGTTEFDVLINIDEDTGFKMIDGYNMEDVRECRLRGTLINDRLSRGESSMKEMHLGLRMNSNFSEESLVDLTLSPSTGPVDRADFTTKPHRNKGNRPIEFFSQRIDQWLSSSGGMLHFYSYHGNLGFYDNFREWFEEEHKELIDEVENDATLEADYKLKLYTVLSAHRPNEVSPLTVPSNDYQPAWSALEDLIVLRLNKERSWAEQAVENYILFLELKRDFNDYEDSILFSPSYLVDEVWHAHLSFTDRYQKDIMAFLGCNKLIEHTPVLGAAAKKRYETTYNTLKVRHERMGKSFPSWKSQEFWPAPKESSSIDDPGEDSDEDCLDLPAPSTESVSCG